MSSKQVTALAIIFIYMIATIILGLVVSKSKQKKAEKQSNDDFLMASKSLGQVLRLMFTPTAYLPAGT